MKLKNLSPKGRIIALALILTACFGGWWLSHGRVADDNPVHHVTLNFQKHTMCAHYESGKIECKYDSTLGTPDPHAKTLGPWTDIFR